MIMANNLNPDQETQVLDSLRENQEALGWTLEILEALVLL